MHTFTNLMIQSYAISSHSFADVPQFYTSVSAQMVCSGFRNLESWILEVKHWLQKLKLKLNDNKTIDSQSVSHFDYITHNFKISQCHIIEGWQMWVSWSVWKESLLLLSVPSVSRLELSTHCFFSLYYTIFLFDRRCIYRYDIVVWL